MAGAGGVNGSGRASLQASPAAAAAPPLGRTSLLATSPSAATTLLRSCLQASPSAPSFSAGCGAASTSSSAAAATPPVAAEDDWFGTGGEGQEGQYVCQVSVRAPTGSH